MEIIVYYYILAIFLACFFTAAYLYWVLLRNQQYIIKIQRQNMWNQQAIMKKMDYIAQQLIDKKYR